MNILKRWINDWPKVVKDTFAAAGFLWLMIEVFSYYFPIIQEYLNLHRSFAVHVVASCIYGILKNYPKSSCTRKIRGRDSWIELRIGDAFKTNGALIVPMNNALDVSLNGNVKKAKSIQNKFIVDYYGGDESKLQAEIEDNINPKEKPFSIGKVIAIEKEKKKIFRKISKRFYLLVNSKKQDNFRVNSTLDDFMGAVSGLWDYLANDSCRDESVTIPLINTQHGRNPDLTRESVVKQIIFTFIETSKYKSICEKLIISIYPSDLKKGRLNFDELSRYLSFQCQNYKDIIFDSKSVGEEIEPSVISDIKT